MNTNDTNEHIEEAANDDVVYEAMQSFMQDAEAVKAAHVETETSFDLHKLIGGNDTQFRAGPINEGKVKLYMRVILDDITFETPIKIASLYGCHYKLTDGFHRVEAYKRLGIRHIPAHQHIITEVSYEGEAEVMAMGANIKHGVPNTLADYHKILLRLITRGDVRLKKNAFELDINATAKALGADRLTIAQVYGKYKGTKDAPLPSTLSQECKARRDEAILEDHFDGMNPNAIATKYRIASQKTVAKVIEEAEAKHARWDAEEQAREAVKEAAKKAEREAAIAEKVRRDALTEDEREAEDEAAFQVSLAAIIAGEQARQVEAEAYRASLGTTLPMADTRDRPETRVDMDEYFKKVMSGQGPNVEGKIEYDADGSGCVTTYTTQEDGTVVEQWHFPEDNTLPDFDIYATTGFKRDDELSNNTIGEEMSEANWAKAWNAMVKAKEAVAKKEARLLAVAEKRGFELPA